MASHGYYEKFEDYFALLSPKVPICQFYMLNVFHLTHHAKRLVNPKVRVIFSL
jgi:hypothetical protein